ncbi:MAG: hypothetical protein LBQ23_01155 [Puniceicoccales bacterium]|jgi:type II secretory pathway component PulJ|nr:hypothetical protein [Puniceicoccales bacterium]
MGLVLSRRKGHIVGKAFTLLEVMLSLFAITIIAFLGRKLISAASNNTQSIEETKVICRELNTILTYINDDLEAMVLLDKKQLVFEICKHKDDDGFKLFFFTTNNEQHITTAVQYNITELEFGKIEISRITLDSDATLSFQKLLTINSSMEKFFEEVDDKSKHIHKFSIPLSDFKIRVAIKTYNENTVFIAPNSKMMYSRGVLSYEKNSKSISIMGNLSFFDVTLRALSKSDAMKLRALVTKDIRKAKDFLISYARSSFARIVPNSMPFQ